MIQFAVSGFSHATILIRVKFHQYMKVFQIAAVVAVLGGRSFYVRFFSALCVHNKQHDQQQQKRSRVP